MKILHVTDMHYQLFVFSWITEQQNSYDAICLTGDFLDETSKTPIAEQQQFILDWIHSLTIPAFVCSGNHDVIAGSTKWLKKLPNGDGSIQKINGIVIGSAPEDCEDFYKYRNCDILLHHYPPSGSKTVQIDMAITLAAMLSKVT